MALRAERGKQAGRTAGTARRKDSDLLLRRCAAGPSDDRFLRPATGAAAPRLWPERILAGDYDVHPEAISARFQRPDHRARGDSPCGRRRTAHAWSARDDGLLQESGG